MHYITPEEFVAMNKEERHHYIVKVLTPNQAVFFTGLMQDWALAQHAKAKQIKHKYFVTFSTKPGVDPIHAEAFLCSQADRECLFIIGFKYAKEHEGSNLHYHTLIETSRPIKKDCFKHWIQNFGHVDFKPVTPGTEGNLQSYILKERFPIILK